MEDQYGTALEGHHFFNEFNPGIGITRKLGQTPFIGNTTVYATYKESSRNPSVAELGCADPDQPCRLPNSFQADPPLDEVKNRSFEFGARGDQNYNFLGMDHDVNWTATAFAGRNYNDIIFIGGNRVGTGYFRNVGNTQRMGTELALSGKLGKKWTWYGIIPTLGILKLIKNFKCRSRKSFTAVRWCREYGANAAGDTAAEADQEHCESGESYQIQIGPGMLYRCFSTFRKIGIGYQ